MARTVNEAAYTARRNAILDATECAIETRGYEQMAIADLLDELHISSGAFYHYFDSKPALLMALVERRGDQLEQRVLPIIHDPTLRALDKLQRLFNAFDRDKLEHKELLFSYMRVLYADENAIFRYKMYAVMIKRLVPWLEEIIRQGVEEGIFTIPYPDQTARMIISLFEDFGYATVELFLSEQHSPDDLSRLERVSAAFADALERILGAPAGCLQHDWRKELEPWLKKP